MALFLCGCVTTCKLRDIALRNGSAVCGNVNLVYGILGRFAAAHRALAKHSSVVRTNGGLGGRLIGIDQDPSIGVLSAAVYE